MKILVIILYVMATLLQVGVGENIVSTLRDCNDALTSAQKDLRQKVIKAADGSLSLGPNAKGLTCRSLRKLERKDCRCLVQESLRNADSLDAVTKEKLEFLVLLDTNTQIATACGGKNNLNCSKASDLIISTIFPEKNTVLGNALRSRYKTCESKAKQVAANCTSFTGNAQASSLKECCGALDSSGMESDCVCLLLESDNAADNAKISRSGAALITMLKGLSSNEQIRTTCGAALGNRDCSGVAKALEVYASNAGDADLTDPFKCEKAAREAMDGCATTLPSAAGSASRGGRVESLVCCSKLEGLGKGECGCTLGSTAAIHKDLADFIQKVRSGNDVVQACPNSSFQGTRTCKVNPTSPQLFGDCELAGQKARETCQSLTDAATKHDATGIDECCFRLKNLAKLSCLCSIKQPSGYNGIASNHIYMVLAKEASNLLNNTRTKKYCEINDEDLFDCKTLLPQAQQQITSLLAEMGLTLPDVVSSPAVCERQFLSTLANCKTLVKKMGEGDIDTSYQNVLKTAGGCCKDGVDSKAIKCVCDTQAASCCDQLDKLSEGDKYSSCMCNILTNKVSSQNATLDFLNLIRGTPSMRKTCAYTKFRSEKMTFFTDGCIPEPLDHPAVPSGPKGTRMRAGWIPGR